MNYAKIRKMDISNGPGVRVSIFMQGCTFNCPNCFNQETHDFNEGVPFTDETINTVIELCKWDHCMGLSILGGEPLHPRNIDGTIRLCMAVKEALPTLSIWLWTGYTFEYIKDKDITNYVDVIIDGRFIEAKKDLMLQYRGSSNQRVVDVKRSLKENKTVLYSD